MATPAVTGNFTVMNGDTCNASYLNLLCQSVVTIAGAETLCGNPSASTGQTWAEIAIGASLAFTGSTLDTIQDIRTTDSPIFAALTITNGITAGSSIAATTAVTGATGTFTGLLTRLHDVGNSGTPTFTAGSAAGTGPTILIAGNDISGHIAVTTGTSPSSGAAALITVTFATAYTVAPTGVTLTPASGLTANVTVSSAIFIAYPVLTASFTVDVGAAALSAATAYSWYYRVN